MNRQKKYKNGFTLIELIIYVAIISIIATAFITFSISIIDSKGKTDVIQEVNANVRSALDIVTRHVRSASGLNVASSTFDTDPGILTINTNSSSTDPTVIELNQDDGTLQLTQGASSPVSVTSNVIKVTNLMFTNLTASSSRENIRIQMTLEYSGPTDDPVYQYSRSLQTAVSIRK